MGLAITKVVGHFSGWLQSVVLVPRLVHHGLHPGIRVLAGQTTLNCGVFGSAHSARAPKSSLLVVQRHQLRQKGVISHL